jgi:putative oxidoreductase
LLALRVVLGVVFVGHGAQHLFGTFGGPGMAGFTTYLAQHGFRQAALLAGVNGATELAGGALVLLGLCTPLGAAALLGVMINVVWLKLTGGFFLTPGGQGFEYEFVLGGAALALVFAGGGRIALDRKLPMFRRPSVTATPCLLIGVCAAVAVRILLHG